jgi:hypothetical protein
VHIISLSIVFAGQSYHTAATLLNDAYVLHLL